MEHQDAYPLLPLRSTAPTPLDASHAPEWKRQEPLKPPQPAVKAEQLSPTTTSRSHPSAFGQQENHHGSFEPPSHGRPVADPDPRSDELLSCQREEKRTETSRESEFVEKRVPNKYVFRRPRALQVEHNGRVVETGDSGNLDLGPSPNNDAHNAGGSLPESLEKQRDRLDLFTDLLFVAIISNISEHFFDEAFVDSLNTGAAVGHFIMLYLPAWRIWAMLQQFLNSYFMDDIRQRTLVLWVLVLAMVWGNNAPFFITNIDNEDILGSNFLILAYLVAVGSVTAIEIMYSIWIPWLRRAFLISILLGLPSTALWILTTLIKEADRKTWFFLGAIVYDAFENLVQATPLFDKLAKGPLRKTANVKHTRSRYESFFIIAIGEGVFLLIKGSPLGQGVNVHLGRGVQALLMYFFLAWTYFHGDMSKQYIHALHRRWWIRWLWHILHIPLYGALIMASSGVLYLVEFEKEQNVDAVTPEQGNQRLMWRAETAPEPVYDDYTLRVAVTTCCIDIAIVLFCQLIIGLLNRSLDARRELLVGKNYIRMLPRVLGILTFALLWIPVYNNPSDILSIMLSIVFLVSMWEFFAGFDRGAKIFEPRDAWGLSHAPSRQD